MRPKNKRILVQVGTLVVVLFAVISIINGIFIYRTSSKNYIDILENNTESILQQIAADMNEYASISWLLSYWRTNHSAMELPGDKAKRTEEIMRLILDRGIESPRMLTSEQAASLSEREQRLFAEYCYLELMPKYNELKTNFKLETLYCFSMDTMDNILPLFQDLNEGKLTGYGNFCALGEVWPFNAPLHPAILELYTKRESRTYFEQVTSTFDGVEYLFGYLPIIVDGEISCVFCGTYAMTTVLNTIAKDLHDIEWINIVIMIVSAVLLLLLIYYSVLKNLTFIQKTVREYRETKDSRAVTEKLKTIRARNEVGVLADDFSEMAIELERYTGEMIRLSAEKERISTELALATRIQADMLPNIFPAFPERKEFDIYASMNPAKEVGGDFYDFFLIDDTHLGMVIADVSGKGVPAALFMMVSRILVQNYAMTLKAPAEVLQAVNNNICANNREDMFVTVWLGVLDITTGIITAANAGHEFPAVMLGDGKFELLKDKHGFVIGGMEGVKYKQYEIKLTPGSKLFVYTDGVPEATNSQKELFGTDRMLNALNIEPTATPKEILKHVRKAVDDFVMDAEQFDDLTMLCLEYNG